MGLLTAIRLSSFLEMIESCSPLALLRLLFNDMDFDCAGLRADSVSTNLIPELRLDFRTSSMAKDTFVDFCKVSFSHFSVLTFNAISSAVVSNANKIFFELSLTCFAFKYSLQFLIARFAVVKLR